MLSLILLFGFAETTPAYESFTATIAFYQGFTISSGMTELDPTVITIIIGDAEEIEIISAPALSPLFEFSQEVDLYFGLTTDPNYPIEVVAEQIAGMAVLEDTDFEDVTDDLLATLDFTEQVVSIDHDDLVVLLFNKAEEEYAMLGDVTKYPDATVSFTYWKSEIPEASTLVLLGVGIMGLIGIMKRKHQNRSRKGGRGMKHLKTLLFALVLLPLLVGTAMAAELRVILIGTGRGFVEGGNDIFCDPDCEETYEKGTVVQLKAFPDDDSTFEGWMVNGKPHEGVITIDQESIIVAARFELKSPPTDELRVMWYNGNDKEYATMVLDEIAVFPAEKPENPYVLEGEYKTAMEEAAQLFHPQAKVSEWGDFAVVLKSPEPVSKEQLLQICAAIKEHEYIWQAGPVLYSFPGNPDSQVIPTAEIMVQFPATYSENRIMAIEQEYGLTRWRWDSDDPYYFVYRVESPFKAIEIANQLYESGQVEFSYPDRIEVMVLHNTLLEEDSFADHWHLQGPEQNGANVLEAWTLHDKSAEKKPIRGSGVVIAIVK